ncbi:MAG: serine/threonine protein kinase [Sandaracinaceae bacterium]|nr:serine/threonine protein kinase [Sandaracinaceae bacterium]
MTDRFATGAMIGPYRIVGRIGEGGMGVVYEATHVVLEKRVALKTWVGDDGADPKMGARFVEEGRSASRLRHPNVVDVTDIGVHAGTPYLVMELLEGETLASAIERGGPIPVTRVVDLVLPIIDALAVAHDAGIIHRDLKPQNIFLVAARTGIVPKLLDFGISRVSRPGIDRLTQSSSLLGTPCYMAPEQIRDARTVDARSDVFSLALVVQEMLTGTRAVQGDSLIEVLHAITSGELTSLASLRPDLPPEMLAAIERAQAIDPVERWTSMRELGSALAAFASEPARRAWHLASSVERARERPSDVVEPLAATAQASGPASERERFLASALACPPLEVIGEDGPSGWLGSAAAHAIARRARWILGAPSERILVPAALAGLPVEPGKGQRVSPFDDRDVLEAARRNASRYQYVLRGSVERRRARVLLHVRIDADDAPLATAMAEERSLAAAAREAVFLLGDQIGWAELQADAAEAFGPIEPRAGVSLEDALTSMADLPRSGLARLCAMQLGSATDALRIVARERDPVVDMSSPASRAWTANALAMVGEPIPADVDRMLRDDVAEARSLQAQALFRALGALRAAKEGRAEAAWSLALRAIAIDPSCTLAWDALMRATPAPRMNAEHCWRAMTWAPDSQVSIPPETDAERAWGRTILRRAHVVDPSDELIAYMLAARQVGDGDLTGAESFAAELDETTSTHRAALGARTLVDLRQARFARALERVRPILFAEQTFGAGADWRILMHSIAASEILGRARELADELIHHLLIPPAAELALTGQAVDLVLLEMISHASPEPARLGLEAVRRMAAEKAFEWPTPELFHPIALAMEHRLAGRDHEIARSLRTCGNSLLFRGLLARLFEASGDDELGSRMDDAIVATDPSMFGGASMAHVRAARRAARNGQPERARSLAAQVIEAWIVADDDVPWISEMRALTPT